MIISSHNLTNKGCCSVDMHFSSLPAWRSFIAQEKLNEVAQKRFQCYADLLLEWNKKINLTAITDPTSIILDHFQDSLSCTHFIDFQPIHGIADIGSGGGFPGIPLAIIYPEKPVVLIEVIEKKIHFLRDVIHQLSLDQVTICSLDWRTFLRKTDYNIDLFCARASLPVDELLRVFKTDSPYNKSLLIYWASQYWQPTKKEISFLKGERTYRVDDKKRRFIFFAKHGLALNNS